ncbi:MAG TPA: hypothetical protein VGP72_24285 [Planctomycetota bacterium]|jgi:hypothetical protein
MARASFGQYIKAAFTNRWNLLVLVGSVVASLICPLPEVGLALTAAAEIAFLASVGTSARFQRSIDAQNAARDESEASSKMRMRFQQLYYGLELNDQRRFEALRARCEVLGDSQGPSGTEEQSEKLDEFSDMQLTGINKLLWVYLKLLHTRATLQRFFKSTNEDEIKGLVENTRKRLDALPQQSSDDITEKKRHSLEDTMTTATARADNLKRAKENYDYVELELERIAAKLTALAESAVNRHDPAGLTTEVDSIAQSVQTTEQTIGDLREITGFTNDDLVAPPILRRPQQRVKA